MALWRWTFARFRVLLALALIGVLPFVILTDLGTASNEIDLILDEGVVGLDRSEQVLQTLLDLRADVLNTLIPASEADRIAIASRLSAKLEALDQQNDRLAELELKNLLHGDENVALKALIDATEESVRQVIEQIRAPGGDIAVSVRDAMSVSSQIDECATELHSLSTRVAARARVADSEIPDSLDGARVGTIALSVVAALIGIAGLVRSARGVTPAWRTRALIAEPGSSLRILHVLTHTDSTRGGAIQALLLANAQKARGHHVEVVANTWKRGAPFHETFRPWMERGLPFHFYGMHDPQGAWCPPAEALRFREFLRAGGFDVIHVHRDKALLFALASSVGIEVPAFVSQRGTTHAFRHRSVALAHRSRRVHRIVAVAQAVKDSLVEQGVDGTKIEVVYGSFDVDRFDPARVDHDRVRNELGVGPQTKIVAVLGELNHRKDPGTYLRAFGMLARKRDDVLFVHAGNATGPRKDEFFALGAKQCGDRLRFLGWRSDVPELLAAADIVVNASAKNEGLTGVVREALAMARAVVCTATDGNPEIVIDGETGKLVPPRDPAALAAAIASLLDDAALRERLGAAGRALVLAKMTNEVRDARVEAIYREVLAERATVTAPRS